MTLKNLAKSSKASQEWFELWQMLIAVAMLKPRRIVEIGVHRGGFPQTLRQAFPEALVVGVDLDFSQLEFTDFTAIAGDSRKPSTVEAVRDVLKGEPVDFLFIDGDHNYEVCKSDFELFSPLVRPGGVIGFHDTNGRGIEGVTVDKFLAELDERHAYHSVEIRAGRDTPGTRLIWV